MKTRPDQWMDTLQRKPWWLFVLLWLLTGLLYLPAWKGGFGLDFQEWLRMYHDFDYWDMVNRKGAENRSLYQLTQVQLAAWTALFGIRPLPWFLLFTGLQALNGTLLFRWSARLFADLRLAGDRWIAGLGTLLFLLSPNGTEVMVWKASYHYHIALLIILGILSLCQRFLHTGRPRYAVMAGLLYCLSTFTLELFYTTPWLVLAFAAACYGAGSITRARFTRTLQYFFLPLLLLFGAHLLLYYGLYGKWIPHRAYDATGAVSFAILVSRILHYEFHILLFGRFFPQPVRTWFYHSFSEHPAVYGTFFALLTGAAVLALLRFRKAGPRLQAITFLAASSLVTLAIVLHYEVYDIFVVINDRYLYLTSVFQCLLLAVLAGWLWQRRRALFAGVAVLLLALYGSCTLYLVLQWRTATRIFYNLQYNFRHKEAPVVVLLNLPHTYNGIGLFVAGHPEEFNSHLYFFTGDSVKGRVYDASSYNMQHAWDGAHVTVLDSLHLKVTLNQWGSWWWWHTVGATDYEHEFFSIHFTDPGHEYVLTLKQSVPGTVILFQQGDQWRQVDMTRPGEEQW